MKKERKIYYSEIALYLFVGMAALILPLLFRFGNETKWETISREWVRLIPFFLIFLINNFLLVPKLFFKEKYTGYAVSCIVLLIFAAFLNSFLPHPHENGDHPRYHKEVQIRQAKPDGRIRPPRPVESDRFPPANPPLRSQRPHFNFGVLIIGLMTLGFNTGIKIFVRWINEQEERNEKERSFLKAELAFLKHQISPHFLMNTLNNIHALIDIDPERAKDAVIKLSRLMRYLLYESEAEKAPLNKEIEFLESYIELMRLRFDEKKLTIRISYPENTNGICVPSLLFLPLVENAFKHGIYSGETGSFIDILLLMNEKTLVFICKNSNTSYKNTAEYTGSSGIGLENIRKRLSLIYKDKYSMQLYSNDNLFEINLLIPIE